MKIMLLIGLQQDDRALVIIRHLPVRTRKNWNKTSGPILRLKGPIDAHAFSLLVERHFDDFEQGREAESSEFEAMRCDEREHLFASHRFVSLEVKEGQLVVAPSEVMDASRLSIRFAPPDKTHRIQRPWRPQDLWDAVIAASRESKNAALGRGAC